LKDAGLLNDWNLHRYIRKENKINGLPDLGTDILINNNVTSQQMSSIYKK
jgi:hypothetical protein